MARVLITGSAGFVGFHLSRRLLGRGDQVLGVDGMTDYYDPGLKRDRLDQLAESEAYSHESILLEDGGRLGQAVADFTPEIVVHLAAQAGVRYSLEHPETYISSNIVGTFNLLEALRAQPPRHLMLASTSSVYGGNLKLPFSEVDGADAPVSLYAATKKSMESIAHSYAHLWRTPTTVFRFFTVYGPWGRPDMALFKFVRAIEAGRPIEVYGEGRMLRDFTYIDDLVDAIGRLIEAPPETGAPVGAHDSLSPVAPYRTVNIGGGQPTELLDFVRAVESALGRRAELSLLPMQAGDVIATWADPSLLRDLIGAVPQTPLAHGVDAFVDWYRRYYARTEA